MGLKNFKSGQVLGPACPASLMSSSALAEFRADDLSLHGGRTVSALQSTPIFRDGNAEEAITLCS